MATISANVERLPWCCGVMEAGYFQAYQAVGGRGIYAENPKDLLAEILERLKGYPILFNFYQSIDHEDRDPLGNPMEAEDYEACDLRIEVMKHPKAQNLATFINPNSGNRVDSWMIFEGEIPYDYDSE